MGYILILETLAGQCGMQMLVPTNFQDGRQVHITVNTVNTPS
jgi:hypothetical protein